jgi:methionyl-tRNA formyltransferase
MRDLGQSRQIPVLAPPDINAADAIAASAQYQPDLLVVCDYGQILSPEALRLAPLGGINLHASLLPRYRGSAPINWAIYRGETHTGVSVIHMSPALDAGNILSTRETPIRPEETAEELEPRLAELGVPAVAEAINQLAAWDRQSPLGTPQDPALVTTARRLRKSDAVIKWSRTAEQIARQVRAFQPWPGAYLLWSRGAGEPLRLVMNNVTALPGEPVTTPPGTVVRSDGKSLWLATGGGILSIERLQPAGKRVMEVAEFLRGYALSVGMSVT